jgi:hypothetical protein
MIMVIIGNKSLQHPVVSKTPSVWPHGQTLARDYRYRQSKSSRKRMDRLVARNVLRSCLRHSEGEFCSTQGPIHIPERHEGGFGTMSTV